MANPTWPGTLPQMPLARSLVTKDQDARLMFKPDVGDPIVRNRYTAKARSYGMTMLMTQAQLATLDTFFTTTLSNGSLKFDWADPVTGSTATFSFADTYSVSDENGVGLYRVTISLLRKSQ